MRAESMLCYACGYSLATISADRCPECGAAIVTDAPWFRDGAMPPNRLFLCPYGPTIIGLMGVAALLLTGYALDWTAGGLFGSVAAMSVVIGLGHMGLCFALFLINDSGALERSNRLAVCKWTRSQDNARRRFAYIALTLLVLGFVWVAPAFLWALAMASSDTP